MFIMRLISQGSLSVVFIHNRNAPIATTVHAGPGNRNDLWQAPRQYGLLLQHNNFRLLAFPSTWVDATKPGRVKGVTRREAFFNQ